MPPPKKTVAKEEEKQENVMTPAQQAAAYLKANKADHYNFEEDVYYKIRSSSLTLTAAMDGGLAPGAHRATGISAGGKTSCTLDFMYHFLNRGQGHRGLYCKTEGRLSPEMRERSGVKFVTDPEEWVDGTCFVFESNVYEAVFGFIGDLVRNNPTGARYYIIIDSMDMMAKRDDLIKPLEEASQVAGGALLTSTFLKKTSAALAKRGHVCWFISQVRDSIKLNPYDKAPPRQTNASGGHAVEHIGDYVLEFQPRWNDDIIREGGEKSGKPLGHYCRTKIIKSNNEKYGVEVRYPIRYGRKNAQSVWVEREIVELLLAFEDLKKSGSWLVWSPALVAEVKEATGVELPEKFQGLDKAYELLEANQKLTAYLFQRFLKIVTS